VLKSSAATISFQRFDVLLMTLDDDSNDSNCLNGRQYLLTESEQPPRIAVLVPATVTSVEGESLVPYPPSRLICFVPVGFE